MSVFGRIPAHNKCPLLLLLLQSKAGKLQLTLFPIPCTTPIYLHLLVGFHVQRNNTAIQSLQIALLSVHPVVSLQPKAAWVGQPNAIRFERPLKAPTHPIPYLQHFLYILTFGCGSPCITTCNLISPNCSTACTSCSLSTTKGCLGGAVE